MMCIGTAPPAPAARRGQSVLHLLSSTTTTIYGIVVVNGAQLDNVGHCRQVYDLLDDLCML